jgi:hypothetical protein
MSVISKNSTASSHLRTPSFLENKPESASFKVIARTATLSSMGRLACAARGVRGVRFSIYGFGFFFIFS